VLRQLVIPAVAWTRDEYEGESKIFRNSAAIYTAFVVARGQVARSWVDVGSFHARLVVRFMIFTTSMRNILDTTSYDAVPGIAF
jgi:hypothetical protein